MSRLLACLALVVAVAAPARADDARQLYQRGTTAYALGHFDEAATLFEQSFAISNVPALLFDAAQAHRLAGHKARALELYQSYLRFAGEDAPHREEIGLRIDRLRDELAHPAADELVVTQRPAERPPLVRRPWFWATIGGVAVAVGLAVGLGVGLGTAHAPDPTIGRLPLN
jgi:tetratricopeptide (TPR) repeat protein